MSRKPNRPAAPPVTDAEVEAVIEKFFAQNYDLLRQEGGHVLAEGARAQAKEQVLLYWRKLRAVATTVTETEVKLSLPGQVTPQGRRFVIEGVVDIVRDREGVRMYDLKTHEEADVRATRNLYQDQLNVYAFIWRKLRAQPLDGTAVIATRPSPELREAIRRGDPAAALLALEAWRPVVELPFNETGVRGTIANFARCVDDIEDGRFSPPPPERLKEPLGVRRAARSTGAGVAPETVRTFAQVHCQNCDARFSCLSYRQHQRAELRRPRGGAPAGGRDEAAERELDAWIDENLSVE